MSRTMTGVGVCLLFPLTLVVPRIRAQATLHHHRRTVHISAINTYITETGTAMAPQDLSASTFTAMVPDGMGGYITFAGSGTANGTFDIPNVPVGHYYLRYSATGFRFLWTSASNIDFGLSAIGRANAVSASSGTTLDLALSRMSPWQNPDDLEIYVPNNGAGLENFETGAFFPNLYTPPAVGATSFIGSLLWGAFSQPLIDGSQGDNLYVLKLGSLAQGGFTWSYLQNIFGPQGGIVQSDGASTTVSGSFASPPLNATFHAAANVSTFIAAVAGFGAGPSPGGTTMGVFVQPSEPDTGTLGLNPALVGYDASHNGVITTDFDAGDIPYADPFPLSWTRYFEFVESSFQQVIAPSASSPTFLFLSSGLFTTTMPSATSPATTLIGAPTGLTINGASLAQPQTGVGTTPRIAWQAPPASSATSNFRVRIWKLAVTPTGGTAFSLAVVVQTTSTAIKIPPGLLTTGETYVVQIDDLNMPVDWTTAPQRFAMPLGVSNAISNPFTP